MRVVAIIQARMGSTRLPGKVLKDLGGDTVLARVVSRVRRCRLVNEVVVATSRDPANDVILKECQRLETRVFRGSERDVLERYYQAACEVQADVVVRITSDCPLIDPQLTDDTIRVFIDQHCEYASNVFPRTYPRGLDVEVFSSGALMRAWREARSPHEREHVTPYFYEHPEWFPQASLRGSADYSKHRWTLDTAEDLQLIRAIYSRMGNRDDFCWREVLDLMEREPELAELNAHVMQKSSRGS
ncbi:MAG: glycosyltransferase family protein [Acidobacteriia bacterium]|nr:glycosyltransferase family protein [Terriglobia bacterium]